VLRRVEPYEYLKDLLERRATNQQVAELTPLKWKKARQSALSPWWVNEQVGEDPLSF